MAETQQINQTTIPDYAKPYVETMLGQTAALTDINQNPYEAYQGERIAQYSDLQNQAYAGAEGMQPNANTATAVTGLQGLAQLAGNYGYSPNSFNNQFQNTQGAYSGTNYGNTYQGTGAYQGTQTSNQYQGQAPYAGERFGSGYQSQAPYVGERFGNQFQKPTNTGYNAALMGAAQSRDPMMVSGQNWGQQSANDYMSPYMQSVVDMEQRNAQRQADVATTGRNATAVQRGAYGGSRQAIMDAEAAKNLAEQKGDIQTKGLQSSWQQAQQQFNADQARSMQGQMSNQGAGMQTDLSNTGFRQQAGASNQAAQNQAMQFGAGQGLTAEGMRAQYGMAANQLTAQERQYAAQMGLTNAQYAAQFGQSANQMNMQQQQYGYGAGLTNAQNSAQYGQAASQLNAQQQQYAAQMGLSNAQYAAQFGQAANQMNMQQQQYGYGQGAAADAMRAQYGQSAAQLGEQSSQYGAGLGLQGLQAGMAGYGQMGQLGNQLYNQQMGIYGLQNQFGTQQQQQAQNILGTQYQDFLNQQNYPYKNLAFMSDMTRGVPLTQQSSSIYQSAPAPNILGMLGGAAATYFGSTASKANGGIVGMAYGGSVLGDGYIRKVLSGLPTEELDRVRPKDQLEADMLLAEKQHRARLQQAAPQGIGMLPQTAAEPTEQDGVVSAARGGIMAFQEGGSTAVPTTTPPEESGSAFTQDFQRWRAAQMAAAEQQRNKIENETNRRIKESENTGPLSYLFGDPAKYRAAKATKDAAEKRAKAEAAAVSKASEAAAASGASPQALARETDLPFDMPLSAHSESVKKAKEEAAAKGNAAAKGKSRGTGSARTSDDDDDDATRKTEAFLEALRSGNKEAAELAKAYLDSLNTKASSAEAGARNKGIRDFGLALMAKSASSGSKGILGALADAAGAAPVGFASYDKEQEKAGAYRDLATKQALLDAKERAALNRSDVKDSATHGQGERRLGLEERKVDILRQRANAAGSGGNRMAIAAYNAKARADQAAAKLAEDQVKNWDAAFMDKAGKEKFMLDNGLKNRVDLYDFFYNRARRNASPISGVTQDDDEDDE